MKVLNLYSGIGGNRKLWEDVEVTAVELNPEIAKIYQDFFPDDNVIVGDAHEYLLEHFKEYEFIWASPPCPTHSRLRLLSVNRGLIKLEYPDMKLYQEIIILQNFFKGKYVIENVIGYYDPLIMPQQSGRHYFWANFRIGNMETNHLSIKNRKEITLQDRMKDHGFIISNWHNYKGDKHKILKNCVDPSQGEHIFNCARNIIKSQDITQGEISFVERT